MNRRGLSSGRDSLQLPGEKRPALPESRLESGDEQTLQQTYFLDGSASCVQSFDDSQVRAIRMTYRISLRSSSLWEPRHPLLKVFDVTSFAVAPAFKRQALPQNEFVNRDVWDLSIALRVREVEGNKFVVWIWAGAALERGTRLPKSVGIKFRGTHRRSARMTGPSASFVLFEVW